MNGGQGHHKRRSQIGPAFFYSLNLESLSELTFSLMLEKRAITRPTEWLQPFGRGSVWLSQNENKLGRLAQW